MTAKQKLEAKTNKMSPAFIITILKQMAKPWDEYTIEERIVRTHLLKSYEQKMGFKKVDNLLDELEVLEETKRK